MSDNRSVLVSGDPLNEHIASGPHMGNEVIHSKRRKQAWEAYTEALLDDVEETVNILTRGEERVAAERARQERMRHATVPRESTTHA